MVAAWDFAVLQPEAAHCGKSSWCAPIWMWQEPNKKGLQVTWYCSFLLPNMAHMMSLPHQKTMGDVKAGVIYRRTFQNQPLIKTPESLVLPAYPGFSGAPVLEEPSPSLGRGEGMTGIDQSKPQTRGLHHVLAECYIV